MGASIQTVDFSLVEEDDLPENDDRPYSSEGKLLTAKQIRARARRRRKRNEHLTEEERAVLYKKPIDEWDLEELAHGRPRNSRGHFSGPAPTWIDRSVYEDAMQRYTAAVRTKMKASTVDALTVISNLINNEEYDDKGKPLVPASTKADLAKFLIEHVVGKPTQRIENDVSVKLQAILGQVMVNPSELATGNYLPGHMPGVTMALAIGDGEEEEDNGN